MRVQRAVLAARAGGYFAVALDGDKRPVDACASNMGHCLWTGIVDEDKAPRVAEQLLSPEMFSGWGIRTLGTAMGAYNPVSYHNGSVWPHDNAIIAAGLMRYGFVDEAQRVARAPRRRRALRRPAARAVLRLRPGAVPVPVPYPTSCSPQAWAAAAPILLVRTLLRLDPWVPAGRCGWRRRCRPRSATCGSTASRWGADGSTSR